MVCFDCHSCSFDLVKVKLKEFKSFFFQNTSSVAVGNALNDYLFWGGEVGHVLVFH